jgi:hypothetical protein
MDMAYLGYGLFRTSPLRGRAINLHWPFPLARAGSRDRSIGGAHTAVLAGGRDEPGTWTLASKPGTAVFFAGLSPNSLVTGIQQEIFGISASFGLEAGLY